MSSAERRRLRRVAVAAVSGQAIEYYDFLLYGSAAALVFGPVFFPSDDAAVSTTLAFVTFAVGFVVRPVGALIFGHLGDRIGRRRTLLITLLAMGCATTLIGALPTHDQVGIAAPVLLVFLRCVQGVSIGGEWGGAALLAVEHAPPGRRPLWGSLPQMGSPLGLLMSTLALLGVSQLPDAQFHSWGWRLPFLFTAALLAVGIRARMVVTESPEFAAASVTRDRRAVPLLEVLRGAPWPLIAGLFAATITTAGFYLVNTFTIAYAVDQLGLDRDVGLVGQIVTGCVQLVLVPIAGAWALRRRPRYLASASAALLAVWAFPLYALMQTGIPAAIWVGQAVATVFLTGVWALLPEILSAQFPVHVRYTGISLAVQAASILGGLAPLAATRLVARGGGDPWLVAGLLCAVSVASALGVLASVRRTRPGAAPLLPAQRTISTAPRVAEEA